MLDNKLFISSDLPAPLENDEVIQYIKKAHNGDLQARKKVIIHNIRLVLSIVLKKYNNTPYDKEELVSVGFLGLIHAIDTFDIEKNLNFLLMLVYVLDMKLIILCKKRENIYLIKV